MTSMTDISAATVAARETTHVLARENARHDSGRFGAQEHTAPELALTGLADADSSLAAGGDPLAGPYAPGQPVYATIVYEEYASEFDEHPVHVGTQKADVAGILDTLPLDDVTHLRDEIYADTDHIFYALQEQGALTHPDYPFRVELDRGDLDAYADYREVNEQADPVAETAIPAIENLTAAVDARKAEIARLQEQLAEAQAEKEAGEERIIRAIALRAHPTAAGIVVQLDHPRYPVEVFDADNEWVDISEEGEAALVAAIREHLGDDPAVVGGRGTARVVELRPAE